MVGAGGNQVADQGGECHQVAAESGLGGSVSFPGCGELGRRVVVGLFRKRELVRCPGGIGLTFPGGFFGARGGVRQRLLQRAGRAEQLTG